MTTTIAESETREATHDEAPRNGGTSEGSPFEALLDAQIRAASGFASGLVRLTELSFGLGSAWLRELSPPLGSPHMRARAKGQLGRVSPSRLGAEAEHLARVPAKLVEALLSADPEHTAKLFGSMAAEYLADAKELFPGSLVYDPRPLAEAMAAAYAEGWSGESAKTVERLVRSMAVKSRYGLEYFANPDTTEVGLSPREVVAEVGRRKLYRYAPAEGVTRADAAPVLLVYSVINRPYILDLVPGMSFVEHLLGQGLDVYLVDWGETEPGDRETTLDDYLDPGIHECIRAIKELTGAPRVTLFGHCIGGVMAAMYTALFPEDVDRLVSLTAPFTAPEGGVVALWTDPLLFPIDAVVEAFGHVPGKLIRYTFMALKPYYEVAKWKMFLDGLPKERAVSYFHVVDKWANDNVDIPGEVFRKFIKEVYHQDRLRRGEAEVLGRRVDLSTIECPLLNVTASKDWIVPPASATVLNDVVASDDARHHEVRGHHVAIMIDPRARTSWSEISDFMLGR